MYCDILRVYRASKVVPNGHYHSPPSIYNLYTLCRPSTFATMSVCPLLSCLSLSRQPRPEDCRLVGLYTYLYTILVKPNALPSMSPEYMKTYYMTTDQYNTMLHEDRSIQHAVEAIQHTDGPLNAEPRAAEPRAAEQGVWSRAFGTSFRCPYRRAVSARVVAGDVVVVGTRRAAA